MTISVKVDDAVKHIHACYSGPFEPEELLSYFLGTWSTNAYEDYNELFDARNMDVDEIEFTTLLSLAKTSTKTFYDNPQTKKAIVIQNSDQKTFMEFYQSARSMLSFPASTIRVFDKFEDAIEWLN